MTSSESNLAWIQREREARFTIQDCYYICLKCEWNNCLIVALSQAKTLYNQQKKSMEGNGIKMSKFIWTGYQFEHYNLGKNKNKTYILILSTAQEKIESFLNEKILKHRSWNEVTCKCTNWAIFCTYE